MRSLLLTTIMIAGAWTAVPPAGALGQLFGPRRLGQSLARRPGPGAVQTQEDVGSLQGNERFLRQNRRPTDFVGPDIRELQRFIGVLQGRVRGQVPSSTEGLRRRVDRSATMNQPLAPPPKGIPYYPRLDVNIEVPAPRTELLEQSALDTLARSPQMSATSRIEVWVEGRTAILLGEVPSARDRDLAAILLSFEPGISEIRNQLRVNPDLPPSPESLGALRARQEPREAWTTMSHGSRLSSPDQVWSSTDGRPN